MRSSFLPLACCLSLLSFGIGFAEPRPITIDGTNFEIQRFEEGALAFGNRKYVWEGIPERFAGWYFTQTGGGERAFITFTAPEDGPQYMATSAKQQHLDASGWHEVAGQRFLYTDGGRTQMAVFERACKKGGEVIVPQRGWTGGILLAPRLARGREYTPAAAPVPGIVVDESPEPMRVYIGCPGIAVLRDGSYVASHSWFGPGTTNNRLCIFASHDRGLTWEKRGEIDGQWWSSLFVHNDALYVIGVSGRYGNTVIRRSTDGGKTWTTPADKTSGLLLDDGKYHCAPVPLAIHKGRLWRAMEDARGPGSWGSHFRAFVMSVPVDADLLDAANWTFSNRLEFDPDWFEAANPGWLEGNMVVTPENEIVNILRFNDDRGDRAAIVRVSEDGTTVTFDPEHDFIDFPGGRAKFTIRFDPETKRYWSLVNKQCNPDAYRNILVLTSSANLRDWKVERCVIEHPDPHHHAFQYVDWLFEEDDLIAASRTAWGFSHNAHNANYLTFHRVKDFRNNKP